MNKVEKRTFPRGAALLAFLLTDACALLAPPARNVDAQELHRFEADTAHWVRQCYRAPRVASAGRRIATRLRVRYGPDGSLIGLPVVVSQSGVTATNQDYAAKMAEAASLAVIRCAPIRVPPALAREPWNDLDLLFSPTTLA